MTANEKACGYRLTNSVSLNPQQFRKSEALIFRRIRHVHIFNKHLKLAPVPFICTMIRFQKGVPQQPKGSAGGVIALTDGPPESNHSVVLSILLDELILKEASAYEREGRHDSLRLAHVVPNWDLV